MFTKRRMFLALIPMTLALSAGSPTFALVRQEGGGCAGNRVPIVVDPNGGPDAEALLAYDDNHNNTVCWSANGKHIRYTDDKG